MLNYNDYICNMKKEFTVYLDMDGVICDFNRRFVNLKANEKGISFEDYKEVHGLHNAWGIVSDAGIEWWSEMDWMHDGKILWEYLKKYNPTILSAPSRDAESAKGKVIWVNRELGLSIDDPTRSPKNHRWAEDSRMILNPQKYLFSKRHPNSILIDDTPKKVRDWKDNGGIGILHKDAYRTIEKFEEIIKNL